MCLWVHIPGTCFAQLPGLSELSAYVALLWMWRHGMPAAIMRLTRRCSELLLLLASARWLSTSQVHRRHFKDVSIEAARKRLRKLESGQYVFRYRENQMMESLFSLGPKGRLAIESQTGREVRLERRPPKQLEHFVGINDLRIAAEMRTDLKYFFACWELPALKWRYPVIPDAVCGVKKQTFAIEFDRGQESLRFFVRTKLATYGEGLVGFPLDAVLVIADRDVRMRSLMKCAPVTTKRLLFSSIDWIRDRGLFGAAFYDRAGREASLI